MADLTASSQTSARLTRLFVADAVCSTGMTTLLTGSFLAAFALTLGADNKQVGLFTAMILVGQPMQLVGLLLLQKVSSRRRIVVVCAGAGRLALLPIVVESLRSTPPRLTFLFAWFLIYALITSAPGSACFHILSIKGLNVVFLIAALCGAITLQCLNLIDEPGGSSPSRPAGDPRPPRIRSRADRAAAGGCRKLSPYRETVRYATICRASCCPKSRGPEARIDHLVAALSEALPS